MSYVVEPHCKKCDNNYDEFVFVAGKPYSIPALNMKTRKIEIVDLKKQFKIFNFLWLFKLKIKKNKKYGFYIDPKMYRKDGSNKFIQAWHFKIKETGNLCPNCNTYNLEFRIKCLVHIIDPLPPKLLRLVKKNKLEDFI